jgi:hypothetical protein
MAPAGAFAAALRKSMAKRREGERSAGSGCGRRGLRGSDASKGGMQPGRARGPQSAPRRAAAESGPGRCRRRRLGRRAAGEAAQGQVRCLRLAPPFAALAACQWASQGPRWAGPAAGAARQAPPSPAPPRPAPHLAAGRSASAARPQRRGGGGAAAAGAAAAAAARATAAASGAGGARSASSARRWRRRRASSRRSRSRCAPGWRRPRAADSGRQRLGAAQGAGSAPGWVAGAPPGTALG